MTEAATSVASSYFGECKEFPFEALKEFDGEAPSLEPLDVFKKLELTDDYRCPTAYKNGGFALVDQATINKFRTAFKYLIAEIGRKLITGKFNLTETSFPIKCMSQDSILQVIASVTGPMSFWLNSAVRASDPVERMKFTIVASLAYYYPCHTWDKPLNPVLGETY